jgi:outer membrane protein OmpA-like peptidoglycan-associated protein
LCRDFHIAAIFHQHLALIQPPADHKQVFEYIPDINSTQRRNKMIKYLFLVCSCLCLFNLAAHANPLAKPAVQHKQELGLGLGALIGGLVAGPPGAIIGAAGGAWLGDRDSRKDNNLSDLEQRLLLKQNELAQLQGEFASLNSAYSQSQQKVMIDNHVSALEELSQGVSLSVFFRTNMAEIDPQFETGIRQLAEFLTDFPEIRVHLEAHTDIRGNADKNERLSQLRADSVANALLKAGLDRKRIYTHAHGEKYARAKVDDAEQYMFDRRVNIQLSLDTEA